MVKVKLKKRGLILFCLFSFLFLFSFEIKAQDDKIKRFRTGLKFGMPTLVGLNLEYVLPIAKNHFCLALDFSSLERKFESGTIQYSHLSFGFDYFLNKKRMGRGMYTGLALSNMNFNLNFDNLNEVISNSNPSGTANMKFNIPQIQLKLGLKTGKGLFYFCPEIGYAISSVPTVVNLDITYLNGDKEIRMIPFELPPILFKLILNFTMGLKF